MKMQRALNSPLSPHPVGLITTSFSLLQPLRNRRTLRKQNALAKTMAIFFFGTVSLWRTLPPPEFFFFFSFWGIAPLDHRRQEQPAHLLLCTGQSGSLCPFSAVMGPSRTFSTSVGLNTGARTTEAFQKKVYLGEKTLYRALIFPCTFF